MDGGHYLAPNLIKDNLTDPGIIKKASESLLSDSQLDSKIKATSVWQFISDNLHTTLQPTYFKWLTKEVRRIITRLPINKGVK